MLTIACVLKSGGIYDATWVARLRASVNKYLPNMLFRFVCFTDMDVPCRSIKLDHEWAGWWSKIEIFRMPGPVLYLDLDTAVVGDLTDIANVAMEGGFTILQDFYRADGFGSGVMAWDGISDTKPWYRAFAADPKRWMDTCGGRGDQNFIELQKPEARTWQNVVPGQIVSYKVHCRAGLPPAARLVCLHGAPKFAEMPADDAVRQAWEMAA